MLPNRDVLDENVETNFNDMFKGIKLSKKAEGKVKELLTNAVALTYKLKQAIHHHNNITTLHNAMVQTFNHKFENVTDLEENVDEVENKEVTQESNSPEVSNEGS